MSTKLLVLGAGFYYIPIFEKLKRGDFYLIAVDRSADAPGKDYVDEFYPIDISDKHGCLELVKKLGIQGVVPVNDFGTRTAGYINDQMGFKGISEHTAHAANDKGVMRDVWKQNGLPIPDYEVIATLEELKQALIRIGYPAVLKPTDCGGSGRGISVIATNKDVEEAYEFAKPFVKNNRFIVEGFVEGTECTVEGLSVDGNVTILAISDKIKAPLRTRVATSLNYPAKISPDTEAHIIATVSKAVLSLGITNGMSHTELILDQHNHIWLLETGARGGGGHVFHTIIEACSGINAPLECAKVVTGQSVTLPTPLKRGVTYRFFNPEPGILKEVLNIEKAKQNPGVLALDIVKKPGDKIGILNNSQDRVGYVVTTAEKREASMALADQIETDITFVYEEGSIALPDFFKK